MATEPPLVRHCPEPFCVFAFCLLIFGTSIKGCQLLFRVYGGSLGHIVVCQRPMIEEANKPRHATPTSRIVSMIYRYYPHNPVIADRLR